MKRLGLLLIGWMTCAGWVQGSPKPSIILILADDLGWSDAAFAGSRFYETPNLDALAAGGMRFTSFYGSPNGPPTRASILSGQYSPRTGIYSRGSLEPGDPTSRRLVPPPQRTSLQAGTVTVAQVLRDGGYATGFFGKWELGTEPADHPTQHGFQEAIVTLGKHFGFETLPPTEVPADLYLTDYLAERALAFITAHKNQPFFLYLAHLAVNEPYEARPSDIARFARRPPAGGHRDVTYAAMIAALDESVGRIMTKLVDLGITDDTVLFFLSDNGGSGGYVDPENSSRRTGITDNSPLRGGKGMLYEGGLRVPFLVQWPGVVHAGSRTSQPSIHVDLFPTLCDLAGARPPAGLILDGVSLAPLLRNPAMHLGRDAIYWHFPGYLEAAIGRPGWRTTPASAVRAGRFKLIEFLEEKRFELYNLVDDLGEKNNLVRSLPEKADELRAKLAAWRQEVQAPMPEPRPAQAR